MPRQRSADAVAQGPSNSLERGFVILERIAQRSGGLTNKQISEELGIATSSCTYVLSRMERGGYLKRNLATGKYEIGLKILAIARGPLRQLDLPAFATPVLQRLSDETGLDTFIGVLEMDRIIVLTRVATEQFAGEDIGTGQSFRRTPPRQERSCWRTHPRMR